jgi:hypothetical protein
MLRTLFLVTVLTLLAGVALGFFAAQAATGRSADATSSAGGNPVDLAIEHRVRGYTETLRLTPDQEADVRAAFRWYDRELASLFRRLQLDHKPEFERVAKEANERIAKAIEGAERR